MYPILWTVATDVYIATNNNFSFSWELALSYICSKCIYRAKPIIRFASSSTRKPSSQKVSYLKLQSFQHLHSLHSFHSFSWVSFPVMNSFTLHQTLVTRLHLQCRRKKLSNQPTLRSLQYAFSKLTDTSQLERDATKVEHTEVMHETPGTINYVFRTYRRTPLLRLLEWFTGSNTLHIWSFLQLSGSREPSIVYRISRTNRNTEQNSGWHAVA